jgi:hypothetical protein
MLTASYHSPTSAGVNFKSSNTLAFDHPLTAVNTTSGNIKVFAVLNGYNMTLKTSSYVVDFDINGVHSGSNSILIDFILLSRSTTSITLYSMSFGVIVWNDDLIANN